MMDTLYIFDTTLRDGEQSPGASMTLEEKVRIATALERMRVDVIEAGFAIASEGDFRAVEAIANRIKDAQVCSLARAKKADIERAALALKNAVEPRIHTFIATSDIHMNMKLKLTPDQVIEQAVSAVKLAKKYTDNVEFSPEDAGRSNIDFLCRIIEKTIAAGAKVINIPDTVGYTIPQEFGYIFKQILERVPNSDKVIFSAHCHNDLGLAVANSMAAIDNGARQIECTINGLGERAGNTALEEVVMAYKTRQKLLKKHCRIDCRQLVPVSRLVAGITGFSVQPNKAIVGANAFAHESGIHQDGILKYRETYEIMRAEDVGWQSNSLVLGKHSGRAALQQRFLELGYTVGGKELQGLFEKFKLLADRKHEIYDDDLHALLSDVVSSDRDDYYRLFSLSVITGTNGKHHADITIVVDGETKTANMNGGGAVDATFKAIEQIIDSGVELLLYAVSSVSSGTDAQGEVAVRICLNNIKVNGKGYDSDIIVASAKAYIDALNRLQRLMSMHPKHPQHEKV